MVYKWYILPIGRLYGTYHLLREPGNSIERMVHSSMNRKKECPSRRHSPSNKHDVRSNEMMLESNIDERVKEGVRYAWFDETGK